MVVADQHLAGLGRLLQPGREVHLGAEHEVAVLAGAHGDRTGVDAHAHADPARAGPSSPPSRSARDTMREARADRAQGVVVVRDRHAEDAQDRVADVALRPAAERRRAPR